MDLEALKIDRDAPPARGRRRRRSGAIGWLVVLALLAFTGWVFRAPLMRRVDGLTLTRVQVQRVSATSAASAGAMSGTAANGYVVARTRAALSADTPGRIVELNVTEGTVLKRGDVVARLYSDEVEAALRAALAEVAAQAATIARSSADRAVAVSDIERNKSDVDAALASEVEAQAGLSLARLNRERAETLVANQVESQQRFDEARAEEQRAAAQLDAARARLAGTRSAGSQAERRLIAAEASVEEAKARLAVVEAQREQAQATVDKTYVRAPFDGVVVLKDAEVGEVVSPNSQGAQSRGSVATMVDFASLEVQVELPETSLSAVAIGAPASIFLDAWPGEGYSGRVLRIWPTANRQKASVEIRVGFDEPDERLRPEMGARVVFQNSAQADEPAGPAAGSLLVPADALVKVNAQRGVFVLERDVVEFRELQLGAELAGRVLVESGLTEGDLIVISPPASLQSGERVIVDAN